MAFLFLFSAVDGLPGDSSGGGASAGGSGKRIVSIDMRDKKG